MELSGKRFLVIGGAGLIGSHTVDALLCQDVAEVRVYDNFTRGSESNLSAALQDSRVRVFEAGGEILHRDVLGTAFEGIDGVFHFAAMWLLHCQEYPRSAYEVNVTGTLNVLEACQASGVQRLVYSSSASVYGDAVSEPMREDHPYNNRTFYGATKIACEHLCRAMYHRSVGTPGAFDYVGLRYMNVYGPRQDYLGAYISVIMRMLDRIDRGQGPVVYGDGSQAYDFVYVKDCAAANVLAMKATTTDAFYNVGTGVKTTVRSLAEAILRITGSALAIEYVPGGATYVRQRVGCPAKARAELGFEAQVHLTEGLAALIAWRAGHRDQVARRRKRGQQAGGG